MRAAAAELLAAGATLVAGNCAHVFHGVEGRVLYEPPRRLLDDYRVDPVIRNNLGILVLVALDKSGGRDSWRRRRRPRLPLLHWATAGRSWRPGRTRGLGRAPVPGGRRRVGTEVESDDGRLAVSLRP